ncbi:LIC_13387 family protein [Bradyrhizobium sp. RDM4]|uniref:LIC_13387 family protein n=1 Tax=Bradyrhizobium sp. RDM4 TaxID=3378765 RepID=UPI0038FC245A
MNVRLLLRIAAIISLLFAAGHMIGGLQEWSPMGQNAVLNSMATIRFETMGTKRSYLDFFMGFGWTIGICLLLQSAILWQMSSLAGSDARRVRPMIAVFVIATAASGAIAWRFILPVPALFSGALVIVLAAAYIAAHRNSLDVGSQ